MSSKPLTLHTEEEIKIFTNPYRVRIVNAFGASKVPLTVTQVANAMDEVPAKVHYHLKKLLSINVLELDHIEVIKGINAKYYCLTADKFRLSVDPKKDEKNLKQYQKIVDYINSEIDHFRKDIKEIYNIDSSGQAKGIFGRKELYLSDDEFMKLQDYINEFVKEHVIKSGDAKKYSTFVGIIRKKD